jgi:hypothetical protein
MAILIRGKEKGKEVKLLQWCNDWFMIEGAEKRIVSPVSLQLDANEMMRVTSHKNNGMMFGLFSLDADGTFKRRKR